jgi:hypothetical protein
VGSPPIIINGTVLTLEHVMQRLDAIENKMLADEHIENLNKRIHNLANKIGSKVGDTLKLLREKEPVVNERVEDSPSRIDKLEAIFSNMSSAFSSIKTIEKTPISKNLKSTHAHRNKDATSSSNNEDLKMISVHPNFVDLIKGPICKNTSLDFVPMSLIIKNLYDRTSRENGCVIEELKTKDDNT